MVVRRRRDWNEDDDVWIVVARDQVRTVISAMEKVLIELEADE
jgi:bifunctional DNA-binding transcriptional regulator/antitoxin component of YhaV-PrlF toxin-antitoxin module